MAPQKRTRQQAGDLSSESLPRKPPAKRIKTRTWESPPEFWDRLSKIALTHGALRELDRRTELSRTGLPRSRHSLACTTSPFKVTRALTRALTRLANDGGPDLSDLRGHPSLPAPDPTPVIMTSRHSSQSGGSRSANPASTQATSATTKSKKSTVYSRNFDQHLTDHGVHATYSSEKPDLQEIRKALVAPRRSLSPSQFSDSAFERFQETNARAKDEDDVLANVLPTILGPNQASHPSARNTIFGNIKSLTDGTIAPAKPDLYYGASPEELSRSIRNELEHYIIPSSMHDKPMAPNFFVEVKGPDGSLAVANRQARYNGALGSRAMYSLQNYGEEEPGYDGKAYTFGSIYHGGTLHMYAHHPTAPTTDGGPPGYHITQVDAWAMTGNRDGFVRGATAFRNARDLAKQYRHNFIQAANSRASHQATKAPQGDLAVIAQLDLDKEGSADEFVDCLDYSPSRTPDEPAPGVADIDDCSQASALPELGDTKTSFASSFTSDFAADRSKRQRQPLSPDSKLTTRSPPSKSRHPRGTSRISQRSPVFGLHVDEVECMRVEIYWLEGHVCFRIEKEEIKTDRKDWTLHIQQDGRFCFRWQGSGRQIIWTKELVAGD
ncbi:hypothetical protein HYQ45_018331 [Verticillium longisporum]|uniref:DUF7924 domain-containing protein n=1 Tax=Verticillium longisporum TaxID=100787 RepID=A0A8I2Z2R4_VERLO|nr:hypothetical protein HYQ45_018331 [Verticillium longisporum]